MSVHSPSPSPSPSPSHGRLIGGASQDGLIAALVLALVAAALLSGSPLRAEGQAASASASATDSESSSRELRLDPAATQIRFTLGATLHTITGEAKVKRGLLSWDPVEGTLEGEIIVDARSLNTGNEGRDRKMHTEVLRSSEFPIIAIRPQRLEGLIDIDEDGEPGDVGKVRVQGRFEILGKEHDLTVETSVVRGDDGGEPTWSGEASFTIPYVAWGLEDVSTFVLRVDKEVEVRVAWQAESTTPASQE